MYFLITSLEINIFMKIAKEVEVVCTLCWCKRSQKQTKNPHKYHEYEVAVEA